MTEFKRTVAVVEAIAEELQMEWNVEQELDLKQMKERVSRVQELGEQLRGPLAEKVKKFERRLQEKDPVTGAPRYGRTMNAKIEELKKRHHDVMCQIFSNVETQSIAILNETEASFHKKIYSLKTEEKLKAVELEKRNLDEDLLRAQIQREAVIRVEEENRRQAENASKAAEIRIQRKKEVEEENLRVIEEKKRREEEAESIHNATTIGPVGVEDGIRRISEAVAGDSLQMAVTLNALLEILKAIALRPDDSTMRRIRRSNPRWKDDCGQFDGAEQVLLSTGFQLDIQDEETVIVMREPNAERDMDGWSTWFENLNSCIKCLEAATSQL
eukprot:194434_1